MSSSWSYITSAYFVCRACVGRNPGYGCAKCIHHCTTVPLYRVSACTQKGIHNTLLPQPYGERRLLVRWLQVCDTPAKRPCLFTLIFAYKTAPPHNSSHCQRTKSRNTILERSTGYRDGIGTFRETFVSTFLEIPCDRSLRYHHAPLELEEI